MDNTNDPAVEKTELVVKALDYAHTHNLDISNKDDVKKIVEAVNPEHSSEEDIEELMKLLQAGDTFMEADADKRKKLN